MLSNNNQYLAILGQVNLDEMYIQQTFEYYQECYVNSKAAQLFVAQHADISTKTNEGRFLGYCDRTMGTQIPKRRSYEGGAIRGSLQRCGLIKASGHELFRGCVVIASLERDHVVSALGYRVATRIRHWETPIVRWQKPAAESFMNKGITDIRTLIHAQARN